MEEEKAFAETDAWLEHAKRRRIEREAVERGWSFMGETQDPGMAEIEARGIARIYDDETTATPETASAPSSPQVTPAAEEGRYWTVARGGGLVECGCRPTASCMFGPCPNPVLPAAPKEE